MCMTVSAQSIAFGSSNGGGPWFFLPCEIFVDNLLVRIHFIIVMIRRPGLAPSPPGRRTAAGPGSSWFRGGLVFKAHRWLYHSTLGSRVMKKKKKAGPGSSCRVGERDFIIDSLLVRINFIIVMIRWTGLAPWEIEFPFQGSLTSTCRVGACASQSSPTNRICYDLRHFKP